jgi:hypothetical protein
MKHLKPLAVCLLILLAATFSTGCAAYRHLQIEPIAKKGTIVSPEFSESYYYYDRDHNLYFIMRSKTTDKASGKSVDQIATLRVFWRPVGGRTTMEPSALNATYRYVLMTPTSVGMYEGAGFVRLWGEDGVHHLRARLMDGDLRLTQSSANFVDTLGRSRVRGNFSAVYNDAKAFDMLLAAHQEFFNRSLTAGITPTSQPATAPGTQPGTQPAATTRPHGDGMQP